MVIGVDLWSILPDMVNLSQSIQSFMKHEDPYNLGRISGKAIKINLQFIMNGIYAQLAFWFWNELQSVEGHNTQPTKNIFQGDGQI